MPFICASKLRYLPFSNTISQRGARCSNMNHASVDVSASHHCNCWKASFLKESLLSAHLRVMCGWEAERDKGYGSFLLGLQSILLIFFCLCISLCRKMLKQHLHKPEQHRKQTIVNTYDHFTVNFSVWPCLFYLQNFYFPLNT